MALLALRTASGSEFTGEASHQVLAHFPSSPASPPVASQQAPHFVYRGGASAVYTRDGLGVAFTGRLDEVERLSASLALHAFADASVLVHAAYLQWGPHDYARHVYGDFSVVLWDSAARRLVLTRSPSGLHPLFYAQRGAALAFASSPQSLLAMNGRSSPIDEQAMAEWLVLQPRLSDRTFFAGVHRVAPGESVLFERGNVARSKFWQPEALPPLYLRDHGEYAQAVLEALDQAVADRLRGTDTDVAAQLSGGLDSSSVAALAAAQLAPTGRKIHAFTAVPGTFAQDPVPGRFFDESSHAAAVAACYPNIRHTCVRTTHTSLFHILDRYTDVEAGPPFNPHHLQWIDSTYAAAADTGATTLLTGSMGNTTISASGNLATADLLRTGRFAQAARLFVAERQQGVRRVRNVPGLLVTAFAPRLLELADYVRKTHMGLEEFTGLRPAFARSHALDVSQWSRRLTFRTARELTLHAIDRFDSGMFHQAPRRLHGLDARDPTYDRRVVELTLRIPLEQFCYCGVPRALIRTAMQGRLPEVVRLERRRGLQSSDFLSMLERERAAITAELDSLRDIDVVNHAVDLPLVQSRLEWTAQQVIAYGWHQYSNRLMRVVSLGRFVRRAVEGTLFSTAPPGQPNSEAVLIQM